MRKALIGLVLAATGLTPVAAQAQESGRDDRAARVQERYERLEQRNQQRGQQRQQREARQEARQERLESRQQAQVQPQPGREIHRRDRGEQRRLPSTAGWEGPNTPEMREHQERYDRIARENAMRYGTRQQRREVREEYREDRRDWREGRRGDRRDWRQDRRGDRRDWNRDWRRDNRYDWQSWRYRNRHIFRGSGYYAPYRNHRYSRFSIGLFLGQPFYDQRYWIGDPWQYRLPPAPPGTRWVRYYNDVLLVDTWDGQVLDVIYDFFW